MATKKSTPGTRSRRNRQASNPPLGIQSESIRDHIEAQRGSLMDAEAVLDCVILAMDDGLRVDRPGPNYLTLIRIGRDFVHSAIDQLDSVNVREAITQSHGYVDVSAETSGVRETPAAYVH